MITRVNNITSIGKLAALLTVACLLSALPAPACTSVPPMAPALLPAPWITIRWP